MKKLLCVLLTLLLVMSVTACGKQGGASDKETVKDTAYVKEKGVLVVGITDFAPMDYQENGEWVGFDADMAKAFAKKLGVECEFVEIDWGSKHLELEAKNIDVVWNGMTLTDDVKNLMDCSNPYCTNAQVVVVKANSASVYQDAPSCAKLNFAVESGSAGEEAAIAEGYNYVPVDTQAKAVMEVASGNSDACIIDLLMAGAMIGDGTSYPDLTYTASLTSEEYGVGFRKGSDLVKELNDFFAESYKDGSMMDCASTYGVQYSLIEQ